MHQMVSLIVLAAICCSLESAKAFGPSVVKASPNKCGSRRKWTFPLSWVARKVPLEEPVVSSLATPPSWDDLAALVDERLPAQEEHVLTFYRGTNGWCPFCETVWLALRAKSIVFRESLISLQDKPEWYKELVPTALVPAVLFHNSGDKPERRIVWESQEILKALDEAFPSSPRLVLNTLEYEEASRMNQELQKAGFSFSYASRNATLTDQDKQELRETFEAELDKLEGALIETGGPFRLGQDFTGMDALMVPALERWRYQLPITHELDIMENRPAIRKWFASMESYNPYIGRVGGDEYSWTATTSMFLGYFGGGEDTPHVAEGIKRADAAAARLSFSFADMVPKDTREGSCFVVEAAKKLISNHDAVVKDCTRQDPLTQKHLKRATNVDTADVVLRYVASILLASSSSSVMETARTGELVAIEPNKTQEAALAARTVAARICAPRDMSAPAACYLRGVLMVVADRLEGVEALSNKDL